MKMKETLNLHDSVRYNLENYFEKLESETPHGIWNMVIDCAEKAMLEVVMEKSAYNQSKAAQMLGITRNTLRKKLINHQLINQS